jgi:hypothetical protein
MGFNVSGGNAERPPVQIPIVNFSSLITNMAPSDLPEGVSPDNSDISFTPGSISSRPGFSRVFATTPFPSAQIKYVKTYQDNAGVIRNLYFYDNGEITVSVPTSTNAGTQASIFQSTASATMKSVTAFGREYIAISDGLHGQEVPLQYDGTYLDRVTQDGPGASASVTAFNLPTIPFASSGNPPVTIGVTEIAPDVKVPNTPGGSFTTLNIYYDLSDQPIALQAVAGSNVTISGNTGFDGSYTVLQNPRYDGAIVVSANNPDGTAPWTGVGGLLTIGATGTGVWIQRTSNPNGGQPIVTATVLGLTQMLPGYQAQIVGVPPMLTGTNTWMYTPTTGSAVDVTVLKIQIDNTNYPGLATVTTDYPHGLLPDNIVRILNVPKSSNPVTVSASRDSNGIITFTSTGVFPGLALGAAINVTGFSTHTDLNGSFVVANIVSNTSSGAIFTVATLSTTAESDSGGQITVNWPVPQAEADQNYTVQTVPSPTTFQVPINYMDGTWGDGVTANSGGQLAYSWDGIFFVQSVSSYAVSGTTYSNITYLQSGPPMSYGLGLLPAGNAAQINPYGQAAPGTHKMQTLFLTRQGAITAPSPWVQFEAAGGQFIQVNNIPIGPSNVVARILAFTGAEGDYFFYIPVPAQVAGQVVSTATQINDNTTTTAILDFSDPTLFSATGINTPGNDLPNQIVLDSALGFGYYDTRLITWGQRSRVENLLNMGFDGGYSSGILTTPLGWTAVGTGTLVAAESLTPARPAGLVWSAQTGGTPVPYGTITQPAYQDIYGAPIVQGNTKYRFRCWTKTATIDTTMTLTAALSSASTGLNITASITGITTRGQWLEAAFSAATPNAIPADLILSVSFSSSFATVVYLDELSLLFADSPYNKNLYGSYGENPEGIDGVSGLFGPVQDTHTVMDMAIVRNSMYLLTQDPNGRLHSVYATQSSEPSGWSVEEVASNCGAVSAICLTTSQSDDASAAGGEQWFSWISATGVRIFGGDSPYKLSQEIDSSTLNNPYGYPDISSLNSAAYLSCWSLNDPIGRIIYYGIPVGSSTVPNLILTMTYIGLDTAEAIASSPPIHLSLAGKLFSRDIARKWTRWQRSMNYGANLFTSTIQQQPVFAGGLSSSGAAFGNCYSLNRANHQDDDYGLIAPYYTTAAIPGREMEQQLQLTGMMKILAYLTATCNWLGAIGIRIYVNNLNAPWPISLTLPAPYPNLDVEWGGGQATGQRFFLRFSSFPTSGLDNGFNLQSLIFVIKGNSRLPVRGRN